MERVACHNNAFKISNICSFSETVRNVITALNHHLNKRSESVKWNEKMPTKLLRMSIFYRSQVI